MSSCIWLLGLAGLLAFCAALLMLGLASGVVP